MRHGKNDGPDEPAGAGGANRAEPNPPTRLIIASGRAARSLFALPPGPAPRGWIAFRAAISIGAPLAILTLVGFESFGLQMATGAFISIYATELRVRERIRVLPFIALCLFVCATLGVLLAPFLIWLLIGLLVVATVTSALIFAYRLGPPGPVFLVLTYGLAGSITGVDGGAAGGARHNDPILFLLALFSGLAFSYLVACAPLLRRAERSVRPRPLRELLPVPWMGPGEQTLVIRITIASALGILITAAFFDPQRAYWTVCASIAVIGMSALRSYSIGRGLHRMVGTLLGAVLFLVIAPYSSNPLLLVLLLTTLQFIIEVFVVRNYALALVFVTPLVLLLTSAALAGADHVANAGERVIDTVIGSVIAILTGVWHQRRPRQPR